MKIPRAAADIAHLLAEVASDNIAMERASRLDIHLAQLTE